MRYRSVLRTLLVMLVALCAIVPSSANIRSSVTYSSFVNPVAETQFAQEFFGMNGIYLIAGGVVLQGRASFFLEEKSGPLPVPSTAVTLTLSKDKTPVILYNGDKFKLDVHRGLSCPLGRFVLRGGLIAFTVPEDDTASGLDRLKAQGVVNGSIAKEFQATKFARLVELTDFADTITIPSTLEKTIINSVNGSIGNKDEKILEEGSYINSDSQVTYRVYLLPANKSIETEGVPLRYYWDYVGSNTAKVGAVEAFSQSWPATQTLTDFLADPSAFPTQYDMVAFYQTAGIFREMFLSNKTDFEKFVVAVCS